MTSRVRCGGRLAPPPRAPQARAVPADHDADPAAERAAIEALRAAGELETAHRRAVALADSHHDHAGAQAAAAYACDRLGREREAVRYYTQAYELGGPDDDPAGFLLGYGSTLRNVGRHDDAIAILGQAALEHPDHAALRAFLALALHSAGHATLALATMLDAALASSPTAFAPYRRALGDYLAELQDAALPALSPEPRSPP